MFLDYLALVILLMGLTLVFYTFVFIHDLPHKIAKQREHPHEESIHVACWLSLFTLHLPLAARVHVGGIAQEGPRRRTSFRVRRSGEARPGNPSGSTRSPAQEPGS